MTMMLSRFFHVLLTFLAILGATSAADGETRILTYAVNTTIASRFARTQVMVDIINEKNCSTMKGFTLQLPLNARVTSLSMSLSSGCEMDSTVKEEADAVSDFEESAQQGKPAALLQAYDATNYAVQISLPPNGQTRMELQMEELLYRKRDQIAFQIPVFPGLPVDNLIMDVLVQEPSSGVAEFNFMSDQGDLRSFITQEVLPNNTGAVAHMEVSNVAADGVVNGVVLPRLLRAYYDSDDIPSEGLLLPDPSGKCFVHLFNPTAAVLQTTGTMPRNLVFVIDVSGSMNGQKLKDAKAAFVAIIEQLSSDDYFVVQIFSDEGTEDFYGPAQADEDTKAEGISWVQRLTTNGGTNLDGAYTDGIDRVRQMQLERQGQGTSSTDPAFVPIVLVLTDGQATSGVTDAVTISRNVKRANGGVQAKVYGLAFGEGADFSLLSAISIQNEGLAVRVYEGYGDATTQMENFYIGEIGTVLLSGVSVFFQGNVALDSQTNTQFPVFPLGSEIAVRARVLERQSSSGEGAFLEATTYGNTTRGLQTWRTEVDLNDPYTLYVGDSGGQNECMQSFAHAKISELMLFHDAVLRLGSEMNAYSHLYMLNNAVSWTGVDSFGDSSVSEQRSPDDGGKRVLHNNLRFLQQEGVDLAPVAKSQALELALEAGVVWPGLTAMVTVESPSCAAFGTTEVCTDWDAVDAFNDDGTPPAGAGGALNPIDDMSGVSSSATACWSLSILSGFLGAVLLMWNSFLL